MDDEGNWDFSGEHRLVGEDHWRYVLRDISRGYGDQNWLKAAHEVFLNSGTLFDQEEMFVDLLREAGLRPDYDNPWEGTPGVLPVYLSVKNPLDTSAIPEDFIQAMERIAKTDRTRAKSWGYDFWDKESITPKEWAQLFLSELQAGKDMGESFVWTRIPEKVTKELQALGYDGIKDTGGKMGGKGHGVWIAFEPEQIKSPFNRGTFDPDSPDILRQQEKGSVSFDEHGRAFVRFFQASDVSTAVHEVGHILRRGLEGEDLKIAETWAGAEDGVWTRAAEEKFARGFERYLRDGKSPTEALRKVFAQMRQWLIDIYRRITGSEIDVQVSPEMRDLFDRLLGGEGHLARKARQTGEAAKLLREKMAGSINLTKITGRTPEETAELRQIIKDAYAEHQEATDKFRRGVVTDAKADERAAALLKSGKISVEGLSQAKAGATYTKEEGRAIGELLLRMAEDVGAATKAYQASDTPENLAKLVDAKTRFDVVHTAFQGAGTEAGRALQGRKAFLKAYRGMLGEQQVKDLYTPLPDTAEKTTLRRKAAVDAKMFPRERGLRAIGDLRKRLGGAA
ncbi:MAG TPA: hypothetical protein VFU47_13130, partial [Armatimonadota bacterium]|nr:hypothetical protein [Armatimonadota bacterium]